MKIVDEITDELLPEYDLKTLRVRGTGPGRTGFVVATEPKTLLTEPLRSITLDADVARHFKTAESVNAVLRALLQTMPTTQQTAPTS